MHLAALFVLVMIGTDFGALSVRPCLDGWDHVDDAKTCVRISEWNQRKTWEQASEECQKMGGDLVKIMNSTMNRIIHTIITSHIGEHTQYNLFWIGLNDRVDEGRNTWNYKCMDAIYTPLANQLDLEDKDCAVFDYQTVYHSATSWRYQNCSDVENLYRFICAKPASTPDRVDKCPHGWYEYHEYTGSKSCIKIVTTPKSWHAARSTCQKDGADLATYTDEKINFISEIISWQPHETLREGDYWVGLNDLQREGAFRFLDRCNVEINVTSQEDKDCAAVSGFNVFGEYCLLQLKFVCDKPQFNKDRQKLETLKLRLERVQKSMKILQEAQYRYGVPTVCERFTGDNDQRPLPKYAQVTMASINKQIKCDLETGGGGWIVIQRRVTGEEIFKRTWMDYRYGFGSPLGDFWLGNEAIYQLTRNNAYVLRIEMRYIRGGMEVDDSVEYEDFSIGSDAERYRLSIGTDRGTNDVAGAVNVFGLTSQNGNYFATYDEYGYIDMNRCQQDGFGWWLTVCPSTNLNNIWNKQGERLLRWKINTRGDWVYPTYTEMKIRRP